MLKIIGNIICASWFGSSAILAVTNDAIANESRQRSVSQDRAVDISHSLKASAPLDNITPVFQLQNISVNDWQWQALKSLSQRYKVAIDFEGDRNLTRYEFAQQLNNILNQLNRLITINISKEDVTVLQRLQTEFAPELASLQKQRVEKLERQVSQLEQQQFTTTTTLTGQALIAISSATGEEKADSSGEEVDENIILSDRVRLTLNTSFTGEDRLRVRLQANNFRGYEEATGTAMGRLGFEGDSENEFELTRVEYRFPVGDKATVYAGIVGSGLDDFSDTANALLDSSTQGAISRFGRRNPIYRQGSGTGIGLEYDLSEDISLQLGYVADEANEPESGIGGGAYGAIAQLYFEDSDRFELSLNYVRSYNNIDTGTGSQLANAPFDELSDRISANSYGLSTSWRVSDNFNLSGWIGLTDATASDLPRNPNAKIFNYAIAFAFPDLGKEGSLAGIVIGQPPKVTSNDLGADFQDRDTSLHLEMFYRFPISDNISATPGLLVITNPDHDNNNTTLYVGTIRTVFEF